MMRLIRSLLVASCLLSTLAGFAQADYSLQFRIDGLKDTTAYLGYYFWEGQYLKDTARVNSKGEFIFTGKASNLPQGVYMVILDKTRLFDFVVGKNQKITMETAAADYYKNMKSKNDPDNKLFFENLLFITDRKTEAEPFLKVIRDSTLNEDQKKDARAGLEAINQKVAAFQDKVIADNPETLTARMLKSSKAIKIPEPPKKADGTIDSTFQLRWYREHFFDNFNLADDAMLRLPQAAYKEKVYEYLDKLYAPDPDTVFNALVKVMDKAKGNTETYKYAGYINVLKFQQPDIMGLDEVFVLLYDKYFASGQMDYWANASLKKQLKEHADRLRKSLVGQTGDNLIMQDSNLKPRSMYDIKSKYTILFIFDPECGHCRKETPKLVEFYNKNKTKFNLEVYSVSSDSSMSKMKNFIKEFHMPWITVNGPRSYVGSYATHYDAVTMPSLYVLDEKKKIIAKKIPIEKMEEFFINYEKFHKSKAASAKPAAKPESKVQNKPNGKL